jgi:hypothetical protein
LGNLFVTKFKRAPLYLATAAILFVSQTSAFAWGCIAVSEEGTYGYSHGFGDENDARERALNECAVRTGEDAVCEITECDSDD